MPPPPRSASTSYLPAMTRPRRSFGDGRGAVSEADRDIERHPEYTGHPDPWKAIRAAPAVPSRAEMSIRGPLQRCRLGAEVRDMRERARLNGMVSMVAVGV